MTDDGNHTPERDEPRPRPHAEYEPYYDYDEVELIDLLRVVWKRRFLIVVGTLACGLAALAYSLLAPPVYEASVTLMVSESKIGEQAQLPASVPTFRTLIQNRGIASQLIAEFDLADPPHRLNPIGFVEGNLEVEHIRDTNMIRARVSLPEDPDLAARVANRLAELAVELNQDINQLDTAETRDFIKLQLDQARKRMSELEGELLAYKRDAQLEMLHTEVESLLGQKENLLELLVNIEAERARLARAEEELAKHEKILAVRRSVDNEPALTETTGSDTTTDGNPSLAGHLLNPELRNEFLNPVYQQLEQQIASSRTTLAALEQRREELVGDLELDRSQLAKLDELYQKETHLANLQLPYDLAKQIYRDLASRYEQTRIQVASRSAQLQVVDAAVVPEDITSPRTELNVLLALVVGLMATTMSAFFLEYLNAAEREGT